MTHEEGYDLELWGIERAVREGNAGVVVVSTDRGPIHTRLHEPPSGVGKAGAVWIFGAGGGLGGPAGELYTRLATLLAPEGLTSLRLDYRWPGHLADCTLDVLLGMAFLGTLGVSRLVLVGHAFGGGGAVVINAGANSDVAALSSQIYGADAVADLSPRSLLLLHGEVDEILPDGCSWLLYARAAEPRELHLYPGCRHGLDECRDEVDRDPLA